MIKNKYLLAIHDSSYSMGYCYSHSLFSYFIQSILNKFYYEDLSLKEILPFTDFENEQVLRNKKSKCMKALTEKLDQRPFMKESLYKALKIF